MVMNKAARTYWNDEEEKSIVLNNKPQDALTILSEHERLKGNNRTLEQITRQRTYLIGKQNKKSKSIKAPTKKAPKTEQKGEKKVKVTVENGTINMNIINYKGIKVSLDPNVVAEVSITKDGMMVK